MENSNYETIFIKEEPIFENEDMQMETDFDEIKKETCFKDEDNLKMTCVESEVKIESIETGSCDNEIKKEAKDNDHELVNYDDVEVKEELNFVYDENCEISESSSLVGNLDPLNVNHEEKIEEQKEEAEGVSVSSFPSHVKNTKNFKCSVCNYETDHKGSFGVHLSIHSDDKRFTCSECTYKCNRKSGLKRHSLIHTGIKLFNCSVCNFSCNHKTSLNRHLLTHSDIPCKLYKCSECNFSCNDKASLKRHLLTHSDIKLFKCPECSYSCNQKESLKRHLLTHSDVKLFKCSECNYSCNDKSNLKKHLLTHTDIKLFKCSECDYSCNQKHSNSSYAKTFNRRKFLTALYGWFILATSYHLYFKVRGLMGITFINWYYCEAII